MLGIFRLRDGVYFRTVINNDLSMHDNEKPLLKCRKCGTGYHYKVPVNGFLKAVLFFLPIKSYFCARCLKTRYHIISTKEEKKYKPV